MRNEMPIGVRTGGRDADVRYCGSESIDRLRRPVLCEHGVSKMPPDTVLHDPAVHPE